MTNFGICTSCCDSAILEQFFFDGAPRNETINAELAERAEPLDAAPLRGVVGTLDRERTIADRAESFVRDSTCRTNRPATGPMQADRGERFTDTVA
jgi:hypothetical protein